MAESSHNAHLNSEHKNSFSSFRNSLLQLRLAEIQGFLNTIPLLHKGTSTSPKLQPSKPLVKSMLGMDLGCLEREFMELFSCMFPGQIGQDAPGIKHSGLDQSIPFTPHP